MIRTKVRAATILLLTLIISFTAVTNIAASSSVGAYDSSNPIDLDTSHLQCTSAALIDAYSGKLLFGKNSKNKVYPASTTKIMTILLALEHGDLSAIVTAGEEAGQIPGDSTRIPIQVGEQMTFKDLLYGTVIKSGNDGSNVIAAHIAGSVSAFVDMMNAKAAELGCEGTNFKNPHGYTDNDHYTTARDLARITQEAMKNPTFREIVSTANYTIPPSNKRESPLVLTSTNKFVIRDESDKLVYPYGIGVKTGYTSQSQHTFVGAAEKDGMLLIAAVFHSTKDGKWIDTARLMDYGFAAYQSVDVAELYGNDPLSVPVDEASLNDGSTLPLSLGNGETRIIDTPENIDNLRQNFASYVHAAYKSETFTAPVKEGDIMGELTLSLPTGETYSYSLLASKSISSGAESGGYASGGGAAESGNAPASIDEIARRAAQSPLANIGNWWWTVPTALVVILGGWSLLSFSQRRKRLDGTRRKRRRYSGNSSRS